MKLLPCPFCGETPNIEEATNKSQFVIQCRNDDCAINVDVCGWDNINHQEATLRGRVVVRGFNTAAVAGRWNMRASAMPPVEEPKLLPCPFCGTVPTLECETGTYWINCRDLECPARMRFRSTDRERLVELWNTRPARPEMTVYKSQVEQACKELKEMLNRMTELCDLLETISPL